MQKIDDYKKRVLITGGAGFIGSHVVRYFVQKYKSYFIVNFDKLTYAGNLENLKDIEKESNYLFLQGDICDENLLREVFQKYHIDHVIHLAAESHVDRSITNPYAFVDTNVLGTVKLLFVATEAWKNNFSASRFYHISTDEVYGSLGKEGYFTEKTPYQPRSPYSASKASADHFVRAFYHTYGLPIVISNCSNNYGPNQFPEKLIPLAISNILHQRPIPIYGKGLNVRDWIYVLDHVEAIDLIFHQGRTGETYNIGGNTDITNLALIKLLCKLMDEKLGRAPGSSEQLITFVKDRAGHDLRYAIDNTKIKKELGWQPRTPLKKGLSLTIDWYLTHQQWLENILNGSYQEYYKKQYIEREKPTS